MITDVFSLAGTSADELRWAGSPRRLRPHFAARDIGPRELARLAGLLDIESPATLAGGFSLLAGESQQSPWVVSVPDVIVEGIAVLAEQEIEPLANRWAHPESQGSSPVVLADYLRGLSRFLGQHEGPFALYIHRGS